MAEGERVRVGVLGYGNVGREVVKYLRKRNGFAQLGGVARKHKRRRPIPPKLAAGPDVLLQDPTIGIIAELTGDTSEAHRFIMEAIERGKHVVTAHKAAIATHWAEIISSAHKYGVWVGFEATVGGGIPIIRAVQQHASNDEILLIAGVMNGTCNFILTEMRNHLDPGRPRLSAMKTIATRAKELGFAEADILTETSSDLTGDDTRFKIAILANLAFETVVSPDSIHIEGLKDRDQSVQPADLFYLSRYLDGEYQLKMLGIAETWDGRLLVRVHPTLVRSAGHYSQLAAVEENYNGIQLEGKALKKQYFHGQGAGGDPTAVSVIADIHEIALRLADTEGRSGGERLSLLRRPLPPAKPRYAVASMDRFPTRGYIRSYSPDKKGIFAKKLHAVEKFVSVQGTRNVPEFPAPGGWMADYIEIDKAPDLKVRQALKALGKIRDVRDVMYFRILEEPGK
jgi:homoserine dehydrogenase